MGGTTALVGVSPARATKCIMKHATVKIDNMEIPLIGIPKDSSDEICDRCHKSFHIQDIILTDSQFLCKVCMNEK